MTGRVTGPVTGATAVDHAGLEPALNLVLEPAFAGEVIVLEGEHAARVFSVCEIADCDRHVQGWGLCDRHYDRWRRAGEPPREQFAFAAGPQTGPEKIVLAGLPTLVRRQIAWAIQRVATGHSQRKLHPYHVRAVVNRLREHPVPSLLHQPPQQLAQHLGVTFRQSKGVLNAFFEILTDFTEPAADPATEFERDVWRLRLMGYPDLPRAVLRFDHIAQPWLRQHIKRFLRWRIGTGLGYSQISRDAKALERLAIAFTSHAGVDAGPDEFDRGAIEVYLASLVHQLSLAGRSYDISSVATFLQAVQQHDWTPQLATTAGIFPGDHPRRSAPAPRSISEHVMAQFEDPANLAKLRQPHRLMLQILMGTGLRILDATRLPIDCLVRDAQQSPYLRYFNHKMDREAFVPIDDELATAIAAQQTALLAQWPTARYLAPSPKSEGRNPRKASAIWKIIVQWLADCGVQDELGRPVAVTAHQFRHTYATRLINADVPQEVVRRLLDHTSSEMTARYARLHDDTIRRHWERARKINIHGDTIVLDAGSPLSDAAWMKENLGRATMALPNGYCGLPLQQTCPHANACLTCPVFITTPEFLQEHLAQLRTTRQLIDTAENKGQTRMVEMNQRVATNLENIINAIQEPEPDSAS